MDQPSLVTSTEEINRQFDTDLEQIKAKPLPSTVEDLRVQYLGRKGKVTGLFDKMRSAPKEERPVLGKAINTLKAHVEKSVEQLRLEAKKWMIASRLDEKLLDISLPVESDFGSLHPISLVRRLLVDQFKKLGFSVYEGPEADFDFYNFTALNTPENHPARDMQDTFYLEGSDNLVLRSHTSNVQIHTMLSQKPPIRAIAPGRTFRCDSDLTHTPMFHQIEAFVVDKHISFSNLKGTVDTFLKGVYRNNLKTRFRPSFFPFVEPGAEMDLQCFSCGGKGCRVCSHTGWIEIGGCGMIHPNVFESVGLDSETYTGFALGFGLDRMAMLLYSLSDLRQLFSGDQEFLSQFPVNKA